MSVLGVVFVILKAAGVVEWSWWWVISPWLASVALVVAVFAALGLIIVLPWRGP